MRVSRPTALLTLLLTVGLSAGCGGSAGQPRSTGPVRLAKVAFCDLVPSAGVRAALGAAPASAMQWGPGDPVPTTPGHPAQSGDEYGCGWSSAAGATARAWIFAEPVSARFARTRLLTAAPAGCTVRRTGVLAVEQSCPAAGGRVRLRRAALYGDAWLTCELSGADRQRLESRLPDWCTAVRTTLSTRG